MFVHTQKDDQNEEEFFFGIFFFWINLIQIFLFYLHKKNYKNLTLICTKKRRFSEKKRDNESMLLIFDLAF